MLRGRWPGTARITATSERRADTARVRVIAKIDSITVAPPLDTLQSVGERDTLAVTAYIGSRVYDGGEYTWERSDTAVVSLTLASSTTQAATVTARKNGATVVRVREARGAGDSARVVVRQKVATLVALGGAPAAAYRACPLPTYVAAMDARGHTVVDAALHWSSSDTTLARVDSTGLIIPLAVGTDTIAVTADTARLRFVISIQPAPAVVLIMSAVGGGPALTVGRAQFALGEGRVGGGAVPIAPARFRIVSSDTTVAAVTPADAAVSMSWPFESAALHVVGRGLGQVTLTPYLCDVPGPPGTLTVTAPHLSLQALPPTARTDDAPLPVFVYTQDSAGITQFPAQPLTVRVITTDSTVMRPDSSVRHLATENPAFLVTVAYLNQGTARLVLEDSAGLYVPDSSALIQVVDPPLSLVGDTVHLGMRQHAFPAWDPRHVSVDRAVTDTPLAVSLTSSDSAIARIAPASVDIPVGGFSAAVDVSSGDVRGTATLTAQAARHTDAHTVVVVGRPAIEMSASGGVLYPGDPGSIGVGAADSATQVPRIAAESVTVALSSSDTAVIALDSATLTIPAGAATSSNTAAHFKAPGTAVITATDPRVAPYAYAGTSLALTVTAANLTADSALSLGVEQQAGFGVGVNGPPPGGGVRVTHTNPAVATLADTATTLITPSFASVLAGGLTAGVDSVIVSAPGFVPDTGTIVVGTGTSDLVTWPPLGLTVGQEWPLTLSVLGPDGNPRVSSVAKTFTLTAGGGVYFFQDSLVITTITVAAGQQSSPQFYVRGTAAGTGTVTISAPNYASVTKSLTVTP